jgi:hypothetical protein
LKFGVSSLKRIAKLNSTTNMFVKSSARFSGILCTVCPILAKVKSTNFLGLRHQEEKLFHLHLSNNIIHVADRKVLRIVYLNPLINTHDLTLFLIPCKCLSTIRTYLSVIFDLSTVILKLCWEFQSGWNEWNRTTCLSAINYFELEEKCKLN